MKKLKVIDFIKNNPDYEWITLLEKEPYCIQIKEEDGFYLLKYNQIESDFNNEIVRECRGLILDKHFKQVCVPFFKFGNYAESYVPEIDWKSARVQEKIDGSLIKVWKYNEVWRVSTNGTINAFNCDIGQVDSLMLNCPYKTFGELFNKARKNAGLDLNKLNPNYTYMFELVSPYNKVVVPYEDVEIYHIGTRDNTTLEELDIDIGIKKPKQFPLTNLEECIEAASQLTYDHEGYVVVDKYWNRVKIKSPAYVAVHHIKNNGDVNIASIIELIRKNEVAEFLTYFPEYKNVINLITRKIEKIILSITKGLNEIEQQEFTTQKDFALAVKDREYSNFYFNWYKGKFLKPEEWLWKLTNNKIKEMIQWVNLD